MTAPTPHRWATIVLPRPQDLPGYAEAVAAIARGESPFAPQPKRETVKRIRRTVGSLTAERDRLTTQRDAITPRDPGDTAGARLNAAGIKRHYKHTDAQLTRYTRLTALINELNFRIEKES